MTEVLDKIYCHYTKSRKGVFTTRTFKLSLDVLFLYCFSEVHAFTGQYLFLYNIDLPLVTSPPPPKHSLFFIYPKFL